MAVIYLDPTLRAQRGMWIKNLRESVAQAILMLAEAEGLSIEEIGNAVTERAYELKEASNES